MNPAADGHRDAGRMKVLHLGHTAAAGGAEFALLRMLQTRVPWRPALLLPPTDGLGDLRAASGRGPGSGRRRPAAFRSECGRSASDGRRHDPARHPDRGDAEFTPASAGRTSSMRTRHGPPRTGRWRHGHRVRSSWSTCVTWHTPTRSAASGREIMRRIVLPRADGVIADTQATLDSARDYVRPDVVCAVIPSASGLTPNTGVRPQPPGAIVVGMLARIDPWKGQAELIEAFARALGDTDARLQLAGDVFFGHEDYLAALRRRASDLGVADRVDFLGHVDDVQSLLDTWHIAVQASTRRGAARAERPPISRGRPRGDRRRRGRPDRMGPARGERTAHSAAGRRRAR